MDGAKIFKIAIGVVAGWSLIGFCIGVMFGRVIRFADRQLERDQ